MSKGFVTTADGRKVPVPAGISQATAEKIAAKIRRGREYWDAKLTATPPVPPRK